MTATVTGAKFSLWPRQFVYTCFQNFSLGSEQWFVVVIAKTILFVSGKRARPKRRLKNEKLPTKADFGKVCN